MLKHPQGLWPPVGDSWTGLMDVGRWKWKVGILVVTKGWKLLYCWKSNYDSSWVWCFVYICISTSLHTYYIFEFTTHTESTSMSPWVTMVLQQYNDQPILCSCFIFPIEIWDEPDETFPYYSCVKGGYEVMIPVSTETHGGIFVTADRCWAVVNVELNLVHLMIFAIFNGSIIQSRSKNEFRWKWQMAV